MVNPDSSGKRKANIDSECASIVADETDCYK